MAAQTILIVDDSRETVRALRVFLEDAGFRILSAFDGTSGLQLIRADHPDLIILDLMLPDHNGLDITRQLRADSALKSIPIIMLTARAWTTPTRSSGWKSARMITSPSPTTHAKSPPASAQCCAARKATSKRRSNECWCTMRSGSTYRAGS